MVCFVLTLFLACVASLQACPEPLNVHIQNYEGPVILHKANYDNQQLRDFGNQQPGNCGDQPPGYCGNQPPGNCGNQPPGNCGNQQLGYYSNQYKQNGCYETECTCVSKHSYAPYVYGGSTATNGGYGCCPVADANPLVYCIYNSYGSTGYSNNCGGNQGYQGYPNCPGYIQGTNKQ